MFEKLKVLAARLDELEIRLSAPDLYDDPDRAAKLLRERNELEPIVTGVVNIGDNIRVVYVGGSGNHARLLIDAPRELNIARSTTEENPARKRETYYAEPGISREAQQEIKRILWNERMKAEAKKDAESLKDKFNA